MEIISYRVHGAQHAQQFPSKQLAHTSTVAAFLPEEIPVFPPPVQRFRVRKIKPQKRSVFGRVVRTLGDFRLFFILLAASAFVASIALYYDLQKPAFAESVSLAPFFSTEAHYLDSAMIRFALPETDAASLTENAMTENLGTFVYTNPVSFNTYTVVRGDTISGIALRFSLKNLSSLIGVNNIENVRQLRAGERLEIPSMDGIRYEVKEGDTLSALSTRYKITVEDILDVNDLTSQLIAAGDTLFIPGAQLDDEALKKALNTQFVSPLSAWRLTSPVGYRRDPINGSRSYHNGLDMAAPIGTPIKAAMSGTISFVGFSNLYGNYVIISHGNGYQTLYGHMKQTLVQSGQRVAQGEKIGLVGMTGRVTGAHLHFTIYKNGKVLDPGTLIKG